MLSSISTCTIFLTLMVLSHHVIFIGGIPVGVNYGMKGDNLPPSTDVVNLYKTKGIEKMRLFDPNPQALEALKGTSIQVSLGVKNQDLAGIAASQSTADAWVAANVTPYYPSVMILYVTAGNEVIPGGDMANVLPAMTNIKKAINSAGFTAIKVTTVISSAAMGTSFPPSTGAFSPEAAPIMAPIISFLATNEAPLMVNLYPYFAYVSDPSHISLDFALARATTPAFEDAGLAYYSLFDSMYDAVVAAVEKVGGSSGLLIIVSESGWPSAGNGDATTPENAKTYNHNMIDQKVVQRKGTPKKPGLLIEIYIFAMFNEDQKAPGAEQHFGLFYPTMEPVYPIF